MSEWQTVAIGEICDLVTSGGTPLTSQKEYYHNGSIPWVKTKEVNQCRLYGTENHITQLGLDNSSAKLIPENSIIIAMYGDGKTAGRVALNKVPVTTNQACCNLILNKQKANYDFVFYNLMGRYDELVSKKTGSGQQNLNGKIIKEIEIDLPSLPEQKAIASVLSSLDDKIDLLHRQNKTLEAMAETLFRQWFIEEAKEDWEDGTLDQLIDLKYGKALKQEDRSGSGYPVVASSGIVGFHNDYLVKGPGIVIGRKGTLGKVYFMEDNFYPIDTSYFIQTKTSGSNLIFEYYLLKSLDFANMNSDSAVPGLNRNIALGTQIQVPPEELILSFNGTAQPWFSKIHSNTKQIQTLEKLRDTLLPKLMSGEVRVQYQTEEVA